MSIFLVKIEWLLVVWWFLSGFLGVVVFLRVFRGFGSGFWPSR